MRGRYSGVSICLDESTLNTTEAVLLFLCMEYVLEPLFCYSAWSGSVEWGTEYKVGNRIGGPWRPGLVQKARMD